MPRAKLLSNQPCGTGLRRLVFEVVPRGYTRPGQYVTAATSGDEPTFFAIASSPGEPLELLVKRQGRTAEALARLRPGEAAALSDAKGPGFALERVAGRTLVCLVNGSGLAAARPVVAAEVGTGLPRPVHLYLGVASLSHRPYVEDLERWAGLGVAVAVVLDAAAPAGDVGRRGFVQHAARADGLVRPDVGLLLVGHRAMIEEAAAIWREAGLAEEAILLNF